MMALLADGWFYISAAGLAVSGVLFFVLLGQYRAAVEAADRHDEPDASAPAAVTPVFVPIDDEPAPAKPVASAAAKPEPAREAPTAAASSAGLDEVRAQLEAMRKELSSLARKVEGVGSRDEALIERLGELAGAVERLQSAPAVAAAPKKEKPAPKPEPKVEPAPAPKAEPAPAPKVEASAAPATIELKIEQTSVPAPKTEPVPAPTIEPAASPSPAPAAASPDQTVRMELGAVLDAQLEEQRKQKAAPAEPPAAEEKPRRGPVWPV